MQPRIFEIRVYITPEHEGALEKVPDRVAVTVSEIVHGQGVGFGPLIIWEGRPTPEKVKKLMHDAGELLMHQFVEHPRG